MGDNKEKITTISLNNCPLLQNCEVDLGFVFFEETQATMDLGFTNLEVNGSLKIVFTASLEKSAEVERAIIAIKSNQEEFFRWCFSDIINEKLETINSALKSPLPKREKNKEKWNVSISFCQKFEVELKEPIYDDCGYNDTIVITPTTQKDSKRYHELLNALPNEEKQQSKPTPDKTHDDRIFDFNNEIEYQKVITFVKGWKESGLVFYDYYLLNPKQNKKVLDFDFDKTEGEKIKDWAQIGLDEKKSENNSFQNVDNKENQTAQPTANYINANDSNCANKTSAKNVKKEKNGSSNANTGDILSKIWGVLKYVIFAPFYLIGKGVKYLFTECEIFKKILKIILIVAICAGLVLGVLLAIDGISDCVSGCTMSCRGCNLGCNGCGRNIKHLKIEDGVTVIKAAEYANYDELLTVEIPASVEVIEDDAFSSCDKLYQVIFTQNSKLKKIGKTAFLGCENLTSIELPNELQIIGVGAFSYCSLTQVTIPNSVEVIESEAFAYNANLTQVSFGNGVEEIGGRAFSNCNSLTSVILPQSVKRISKNTFEGCENLTYNNHQSVNYLPSATNPYFIAVGLSDMQATSVTLHSDAKIIAQSFSSLNEYVTNDSYMFEERNELLKEVLLPDGLKIINASAFNGCVNIEKINISASVEYIGDHAFYECGKKNSVTYPLNSQLKFIGSQAFYACKGITHVVIPEGVANGYNAFSNSSLISVKIEGAHSKEVSNTPFYDAFSHCDNLQYVIIPENYYIEGLPFSANTYIFCEGVHGGLYYGTEYSQRTIRFKRENGEITVYQVEGAGEIIIPSVIDGLPVTKLEIPKDEIYEFFETESKIQLTIPASITSIENGLIDGDYVNKVCFEEGTTSILYGTFTGKGIECLVLPSTLQKVDTGNLPFYLDLKKIYFNGTKERWDSIVDKDFASSYNKTTVYFYSEVQPENSGNYWCYKDGIITVW